MSALDEMRAGRCPLCHDSLVVTDTERWCARCDWAELLEGA